MRLIASAQGTTESEKAPKVDKKALRNEARKARKAGKAQKALLLAVAAVAPTPIRNNRTVIMGPILYEDTRCCLCHRYVSKDSGGTCGRCAA